MSNALKKIKSLHGDYKDQIVTVIENFLSSEGFQKISESLPNVKGYIYIKDTTWLYAIFIPNVGTFSIQVGANRILVSKRLYNSPDFQIVFQSIYRSVVEFVIVYNIIVNIIRYNIPPPTF